MESKISPLSLCFSEGNRGRVDLGERVCGRDWDERRERTLQSGCNMWENNFLKVDYLTNRKHFSICITFQFLRGNPQSLGLP